MMDDLTPPGRRREEEGELGQKLPCLHRRSRQVRVDWFNAAYQCHCRIVTSICLLRGCWRRRR